MLETLEGGESNSNRNGKLKTKSIKKLQLRKKRLNKVNWTHEISRKKVKYDKLRPNKSFKT